MWFWRDPELRVLAIITVAILAFFLLSGCAYWDAATDQVERRGAAAADRELEAAVWAVCKATTAGALQRAYAQDPDGFTAWWTFCFGDFPWASDSSSSLSSPSSSSP